MVRHHGALLGEALHVLGLAAEERFGDEQREIGVHMTRLLEHPVELMLHLFPDGVAIGFDDHAAAHGGLLGQIGLYHQIVVPLRIIVFPVRDLLVRNLCHNFFIGIKIDIFA